MVVECTAFSFRKPHVGIVKDQDWHDCKRGKTNGYVPVVFENEPGLPEMHKQEIPIIHLKKTGAAYPNGI
tara:strand:+ start:265 stop:474 length:210 start_codon:yes stop_codon:yes gene_type:complete